MTSPCLHSRVCFVMFAKCMEKYQCKPELAHERAIRAVRVSLAALVMKFTVKQVMLKHMA